MSRPSLHRYLVSIRINLAAIQTLCYLDPARAERILSRVDAMLGKLRDWLEGR